MNAVGEALGSLWFELPALAQDLLVLAACLVPTLVAVLLVTRRYRVWPLVVALLRRHRRVSASCTALVAVSVALGIAVIALERGVRQSSARAADPFDLIVAAPGSDVTAMLAAVYLQPADLPLLSPGVYARLAAQEQVALAAPLAFGDSVAGRALVGTTARFVERLAGTPREGRMFRDAAEAVVGAASGFRIGQRLHPAHGAPGTGEADLHTHVELVVTGVLAPSGTPWDRAVIVPIETLWIAHGLGDGHAADEAGRIGAPFDAARMPGVSAVVVRARSLGGNYALRAAFTSGDSMAFFPGEVLARLHGLLSDVRRVLSGMALVTAVLVVTAVVMALAILLAGLSRRFAMLRALGAPRGFVFAVAWLHGLSMIVAGAVLGVPLGQLAAYGLGARFARESAVAVRPVLGIADLSLVASFVLCGTLLVALPAWRLSGRRAVEDLRV